MNSILAIDAGNTNICLGIFEKSKLKFHWRLETDTALEQKDFKEKLGHLLSAEKIDPKNIAGVVIANVVPSLSTNLLYVCREIFDKKPLWVDHKTAKIPLRVDTTKEVGADRLCNAAAVWKRFKKPTIVVDFGTATTLDIITAKGEYGGGAIVPGLMVAAQSLAKATAQLPKVEIKKPKRVVGRNTVECIQAGLYYGYVGMIDHLVALSIKEEKIKMKVVATGGLAELISKESKTIEEVLPHLTMEGLLHIWEKNL